MVTVTAPEIDPVPPTSGRVRLPLRLRVLGVLLGVLAVAGGGYVGYSITHDDQSVDAVASQPKPDWARPSVTMAELPDRLGVRLVQVAVTGGGGLIDVRFQVVDPEKAAAIHDAETPPALVAEPSGLFIDNLLMGHAHSGTYKTAQTYYLLFENDGSLLDRGSQVTVLLGDVQVEHVVLK